jgi:hypothetical protein
MPTTTACKIPQNLFFLLGMEKNRGGAAIATFSLLFLLAIAKPLSWNKKEGNLLLLPSSSSALGVLSLSPCQSSELPRHWFGFM